MLRNPSRRRLLALVSALATAVALQRPAAAGAPPLVVFAAASLKNVLEAVHALPDFPFALPLVNLAGSAGLAKQIEQGAPADVFVSADVDWMDYLTSRALIRAETRRVLAGNGLVLIAPAAAPVSLTLAPGADLAAALGNGRLALAQPEGVPAGRYAKAALQTLGLWDSVRDRLLPLENVRDVLRVVAAGEAPLGIVYATDAQIQNRVMLVDRFADDSHPPIVYPAAVLAASTHPDAADYVAFLAGPAAQAVFAAQGFLPP